MGIIQRESGKRPHHIDVEYQDRLDNEIQDCMVQSAPIEKEALKETGTKKEDEVTEEIYDSRSDT